LNDGLQEVKETSPPRKCPSALEKHLCPQAIHKKKKAIKPNHHPDPWDHQFLGSPVFPSMQSFSSLLYK
jgi:hypothetical protein